jgi:hypothetical protein
MSSVHTDTTTVSKKLLLNVLEMLDYQKKYLGGSWSSWDQEQYDKLREALTDETVSP